MIQPRAATPQSPTPALTPEFLEVMSSGTGPVGGGKARRASFVVSGVKIAARHMLREFVDILLRGFRLRCPCCGHGHLFKTTFRLNVRCEACGERFEREPGQWFGAVYVNLVLTLVLTPAGFTATQTLTSFSTAQQLWIWTSVATLGPLAFYRLSKGLWTSIIFLGEGLYIPWPR